MAIALNLQLHLVFPEDMNPDSSINAEPNLNKQNKIKNYLHYNLFTILCIERVAILNQNFYEKIVFFSCYQLE